MTVENQHIKSNGQSEERGNGKEVMMRKETNYHVMAVEMLINPFENMYYWWQCCPIHDIYCHDNGNQPTDNMYFLWQC